MLYLDRNEFNFPPAPKVIEAVKHFRLEDLCFYTRIHDEGKKSVVTVRLGEMYHLPESQVLLGYGGEDILKNAVHYHLTSGRGNSIMIPEFSWWYYNRIAAECGGETIMYPLYEETDCFRYDVEEIVELAKKRHPRILLLASPNNPTGNSLSSDEIAAIMEGVSEETVVIVDEAYASFISTDVDYIAPLVNKYGNLIIIRTLSKFYGLPGLRMGFAFVGKNHEGFLRYANKYLGYNRFSEAIALAALESEDYYCGIAEQMKEGRELFERELSKLEGFKVYKSRANFLLIKYPIELKAALERALADEAFKIKFMTDKGLESCVRITLAGPDAMRKVCDIILAVNRREKGAAL